jgi:hypothetical protein
MRDMPAVRDLGWRVIFFFNSTITMAAAVPAARKKLAFAVLTPADRLEYDQHDCALKRAGACLRDDDGPGAAGGAVSTAITWTNVACVRALVRDKRLDEAGLTRVLRTVLSGHVAGARDYNVFGKACCQVAFLWCWSISQAKYHSVLSGLPAAAPGTAPLGKRGTGCVF